MRTYETPIGKLPSVTTILEATESQEDKDRLRKWQHKQDKIYGFKQSKINGENYKDRGTELHKAINIKLIYGQNPAESLWKHEENEQRWKHLQPLLKTITIIKSEYTVWHPSGYAGTADLICELDGKATLLDWKTSDRPKKRQWIDKAFVQTAAYAQAWNEDENRPYQQSPNDKEITQLAVIVISPEKLQIFTEDNVKKYEELWNERLLKFQKLGIIVE